MEAKEKDPNRPIWFALAAAIAIGYLACVHYGILPLINLFGP